MRTTLNVADDVLYAVKERARREGRSAGEVLSDLARIGLTHGDTIFGASSRADQVSEAESFYGFEPFPRRGPVVSNELIDRLREEESI